MMRRDFLRDRRLVREIRGTGVGVVPDTWPANIPAVAETIDSGLELADDVTLVRRPGAPKWGFFLRAETMHGYYTFQHNLEGGHDFHRMSHGESFLSVVGTYLTATGFYCLDEPEAALSFSSTLALMGSLADLAANGSQVLCATHSPVLASLPGATIYEMSEQGISRREWDELKLVSNWKSYLNEPQRYLRHILG